MFMCISIYVYACVGDWLLALSLWLRVRLSYADVNGIVLNVWLYTRRINVYWVRGPLVRGYVGKCITLHKSTSENFITFSIQPE